METPVDTACPGAGEWCLPAIFGISVIGTPAPFGGSNTRRIGRSLAPMRLPYGTNGDDNGGTHRIALRGTSERSGRRARNWHLPPYRTLGG